MELYFWSRRERSDGSRKKNKERTHYVHVVVAVEIGRPRVERVPIVKRSLQRGLIALKDKPYWLMIPEIEPQRGAADGEIKIQTHYITTMQLADVTSCLESNSERRKEYEESTKVTLQL